MHSQEDRRESVWLFLPRQARRIFVRALAEARLHARRQRDGTLTILVAQTVGGGQRLIPLFVSALAVQADLLAFLFEMRRVHSEQADGITLPVGAKESA